VCVVQLCTSCKLCAGVLGAFTRGEFFAFRLYSNSAILYTLSALGPGHHALRARSAQAAQILRIAEGRECECVYTHIYIRRIRVQYIHLYIYIDVCIYMCMCVCCAKYSATVVCCVLALARGSIDGTLHAALQRRRYV
jgi:hypothetical protein